MKKTNFIKGIIDYMTSFVIWVFVGVGIAIYLFSFGNTNVFEIMELEK